MNSDLTHQKADYNDNDDVENQFPLDYYLQWEWPDHIDTALRRLLWISLVELAEGCETKDDHTTYVNRLIATYPESPQVVLDYISQVGSQDLLVRIAENPQTAAQTLTRLASNEDAEVRIAVAENANTPPQIVNELLHDGNPDVRYSMAENANLPLIMLQQLCDDENGFVSSRARRTVCRVSPRAVAVLKATTDHSISGVQKRKFG